ncbi:MAG: DUF4982 domain-containing protein [Sedimentisphaerales bacterium]|nr:DUF4982 domain-containing protein [Sedimentisphaerales bacterium]
MFKTITRFSKFFYVLCVFIFPLAAAYEPSDTHRIKYNFNPGWKFLIGDPNGAERIDFDDSKWENITTPRAFNEDDAFKKHIHNLSTGIAWYRKHFKVPAEHKGRKVFLEFEGIRQGGEFYLNGKFIGRSENGVMAFGFDITDNIKFAPRENIIAVKIDNSWRYREKATGQTYQWNDMNFNANYGGIVKNVYLHITDRLYQTLPLYSNLQTTGVYIYAKDIDIKARKAKVAAESQIKNEHGTQKEFTYQVVIKDMAGKIIKEFDGGKYTLASGETKIVSASAEVDNLNFWSWGYGYLYDVYTIISAGDKPVDVVKTRTGFRKTAFADGMIKLNDRVIQVKGYAQRTSNEWPAVALCVPPWMSDFSNHLMVESNANLVRWMHVTPSKQDVESCDRVGLMQAMPAGDSEGDTTGRRWQQRLELMRDAIIYNRNNPSIIFYESGNENISEEHMWQMKGIRDEYDPHGGRAAGCREMLDSMVAEYGGEMLYINKSDTIPMWATEYSRDEGLRKYWDEFSPPFHADGPSYNRNQDSHAIENVIRWYDYWRQRPGTGRRVSSGGANIIFSDTNTHFRGDENYRRSGEVDAMRLPKDAFFAHQVMWDGWVDIEQPRIHIVGHWNYKSGIRKNIYVISSADKVELFINGKSKGFGKQSYRFLFTFEDIEFQPGEIKAVGYDTEGQKLCNAQKVTAGPPHAVNIAVRTGTADLQADGADIALVDVSVIDSNGTICPTALNMIDFTLKGPAEWRGGIAQGTDNYILSKSLPVECGVNRVIIRSLTQAGKITLTASSKGLKPATVEIISKPVNPDKSGDGLSLVPDDIYPKSRLDRGPTPQTPSYKVTRVPMNIAAVSAGCDTKKAYLSFDGIETTKWSNDGKLITGWIKYDFEKPAAVSQVELKLDRWRTRSYPIRITVDDKEVFKGQTEQNLGYYNVTFPPVTGRSLIVELIGINKDRDIFNIVEVTGRKDQAASDDTDPNAAGTLSIVEIEIYQLP